MNDQTAKAGFKTFIVTLGVSLALFGVLYYFISSSTSSTSDIESEISSNELAAVTTEEVANKDQRAAVFQDLTKGTPSAVLGAADESTQGTGTVPVTGSTEITVALLMSLAILGYGGLHYLRGPRKTAIATFERDITRGL